VPWPGGLSWAASSVTTNEPGRLMSFLKTRRELLKSAAVSAGVAAGVPVCAWAQPKAAAPTPIFVLNSLDADVSVIDPITHSERQRVATGKEPHHLYLTPDEKSVIVANAASDSLTFIDPITAQVQRTVRQIVDPYHLRFSPDMKWFVTAANRLDHIDVYRWQPQNPQRVIFGLIQPAPLFTSLCRTATSWSPSIWPRSPSGGVCPRVLCRLTSMVCLATSVCWWRSLEVMRSTCLTCRGRRPCTPGASLRPLAPMHSGPTAMDGMSGSAIVSTTV